MSAEGHKRNQHNRTGVQEYGREAGVSLSVMSRQLLDVGDRNRYMDGGFGLVTQRPDPMERKHQVMLSDLGATLARVDRVEP